MISTGASMVSISCSKNEKKVSNKENIDKEIIIKDLKNKKVKLNEIPKKWQEDQEIILEAVSSNLENINYMPQELINDEVLIKKIINKNGLSFEKLAKKSKDEKKFYLK